MHKCLLGYLFRVVCCLVAGAVFGQQKTLFAIAGQSNAVGFGTAVGPLTQINPNNGTCFEYWMETDGFFLRTQDPIGEDVFVGNGIPHYFFMKSQTVSSWPAFANRYLSLHKQRTGQASTLYLVQTAKGGSGCHARSYTGTDYSYNTWSSDDLLFFKSVEKIRQAMRRTCLPLSGIFWLQGESDAAAIRRGAITKEQYKQALVDLIARYRLEFGATLKFFIIKTAKSYIQRNPCPAPCAYNASNYYYCCPPSNANNGYDQARAVQQEVADADSNTFIVFDHPLWPTGTSAPASSELNYYKDGTHYQQNVYDTLGFKTATKLFQLEQNGFRK